MLNPHHRLEVADGGACLGKCFGESWCAGERFTVLKVDDGIEKELPSCFATVADYTASVTFQARFL